MLLDLRGFYEGRKFNLATNLQSLKIWFLSHMLSKSNLIQLIEKLATRHIYLPNSKLYTQTNKKLCYQIGEGYLFIYYYFFNYKISSSQHYPYSLPFFQKYYKHPIYSPFFHHLPRLIILFLSKKVLGTIILKIRIENYVRKRELQMI